MDPRDLDNARKRNLRRFSGELLDWSAGLLRVAFIILMIAGVVSS